AFLGIFNLILLPPFDGGRILLELLPPDWAAKFAKLNWYGLMIGIAVSMLGVVITLDLFLKVLTAVIYFL
ncbi:MAG: site-2 protease family protein, partial [Acidobacteriota bacterium]|nr:site-2 protease family protein [Acidobacteriota bacterium]